MGRSGTDIRNKDDTSFQDEYLWLSVFVVGLTTIAGSPRGRSETTGKDIVSPGFRQMHKQEDDFVTLN